jgi:hypothetical protein
MGAMSWVFLDQFALRPDLKRALVKFCQAAAIMTHQIRIRPALKRLEIFLCIFERQFAD